MPDSVNKRELANASRRVANMTASQIESKRSIDRANQRYCRAKRRTQMEELQSKVDALTRELEDTRRQLRTYQERDKTWSGALTTLRLAGNSTEPQPQGSSSVTVAFDQNTFGDAFDSSYYQPTPLDFTTGINVNLLDPTLELDSSIPGLGDQSAFQQTLSPGPPSRPLPWANHFTLDKFDPPFTTAESAEWKLIPPLIAATTQLDQVILGTTETLRLRGFKAPKKESQFPSISSLLNPTAAAQENSEEEEEECSISNAAAAQVGRSPVKALLARVGFMYVLSHLLRWYICRTKESYDQLPEYIRPTLLQRTIPHPPWIDVIVWPEVRDAIIQHMDWSRFLELRAATAKSLCVGWPNRDLRSVFESVDGKNYRLTSSFEQHLRNSDNWTVGADAQDMFPFLKPVCR
ncbi:hypothetical protein B0T10DRAFT_590302, partial [Thelonectria olida]